MGLARGGQEATVTGKLKLMCVVAHPDDESLGMGGTLAKYAAEGIETYLVTATRGERGRFGEGEVSPGRDAGCQMRGSELLAAAEELGIREVRFLDYIDGDLDQADPTEAVAKIVTHLTRIKPQVVITFGPEGAYGHPDHIAISQLTTAAVVGAADSHRVSKLYYMACSEEKWAAYQAAFRDLKIKVDGTERRAISWPDWAITTVIDTSSHWESVWQAVSCHKTQMAIFSQLEQLPAEHHQALWGTQQYYRTFSLVNGGRTRETDLFEGLR